MGLLWADSMYYDCLLGVTIKITLIAHELQAGQFAMHYDASNFFICSSEISSAELFDFEVTADVEFRICPSP